MDSRLPPSLAARGVRPDEWEGAMVDSHAAQSGKCCCREIRFLCYRYSEASYNRRPATWEASLNDMLASNDMCAQL